jgi:nicotinamidase-related amidase
MATKRDILALMRARSKLLAIALCGFTMLIAADAPLLRLQLRSRVKPFKAAEEWTVVQVDAKLPVAQTAIVVCDMWDKHWCTGATQRVAALVSRMEPVLQRARAAGIQIIHAPSEVMDFYKEYPQRRAMASLQLIQPPAALVIEDPPLPISDKSGGCDTHEAFYKAWTREHPGLTIAPQDRISDKGAEIYTLFQKAGIRNVLIMGVHTNMCVLNRTFAIKQMTRWGLRCILVRDLTDSMYDPQDPPKVSHDQGTELVVEHIEKHWAPTVLSSELLAAIDRSR